MNLGVCTGVPGTFFLFLGLVNKFEINSKLIFFYLIVFLCVSRMLRVVLPWRFCSWKAKFGGTGSSNIL